MEGFLLGAAVAVAVIIFIVACSKILSSAVRTWFSERLAQLGIRRQANLPEPVVEIIAPEPAIETPPPDYGNIRPVNGEATDPTEFGVDVHDFPDMGPPVTRYEDFNRRLFIVIPADKKSGVWPTTTSDDFPTRISGLPLAAIHEEIRIRLRPRYPVIFDWYGYWANASYQLEQNPDYTNEFVETYLAIPEHSRPVVISVVTFNDKGNLRFIRYGFEDFVLTTFSMRLHTRACLSLVMGTMIGPRNEWMRLSVARMRHNVIRAFQADEAAKMQNDGAVYIETQIQAAKRDAEHRNRFLALWKHRIDAPETAGSPQPLLPALEEAAPKILETTP